MQARTGTDWARRIQRAKMLEEHHASAAEILRSYQQILKLQATISDALIANRVTYDSNLPFRKRIDVDIPLAHVQDFVSLLHTHGSDPFRGSDTAQIEDAMRSRILEELERETAPANEPTPERFMAIALLQPAMEHAAQSMAVPATPTTRCPICGALPLLAALRPEGEGAKRYLQCSLCLTEWPFRRVLCPWCGETDKDKLPRFTPEQCNYVRVEGCDTCKHYLKSIDLTVEGHAIPLVDEVALSALDIWADEQGFKKICLNLLGM